MKEYLEMSKSGTTEGTGTTENGPVVVCKCCCVCGACCVWCVCVWSMLRWERYVCACIRAHNHTLSTQHNTLSMHTIALSTCTHNTLNTLHVCSSFFLTYLHLSQHTADKLINTCNTTKQRRETQCKNAAKLNGKKRREIRCKNAPKLTAKTPLVTLPHT